MVRTPMTSTHQIKIQNHKGQVGTPKPQTSAPKASIEATKTEKFKIVDIAQILGTKNDTPKAEANAPKTQKEVPKAQTNSNLRQVRLPKNYPQTNTQSNEKATNKVGNEVPNNRHPNYRQVKLLVQNFTTRWRLLNSQLIICFFNLNWYSFTGLSGGLEI